MFSTTMQTCILKWEAGTSKLPLKKKSLKFCSVYKLCMVFVAIYRRQQNVSFSSIHRLDIDELSEDTVRELSSVKRIKPDLVIGT